MDPVKIIALFSLLLGTVACRDRPRFENDEIWLKVRTRLMFPVDFASVRINSHGERELRISYGKLVSMETFLPSGYPEFDMVLRQITDGKRILQAVYQSGVLKECDLTRDSNQVLDFIASFIVFGSHSQKNFGDVNYFAGVTNYTSKNVTLAYQTFNGLSEIGDLAEVVDMRSLRKDCQNFLRLATETAEEEAKSGNFTNIYDHLLASVDEDILRNNLQNMNIDVKLSLDDIGPLDTSNSKPDKGKTGHNLSKRSTAPLKRNSRSKRAALDISSVLIFPGTKWCGKGDLAQCYDDLGDDQDLDMCCRDHDCCPFVIPPFSSRFNTFNYRFHSLLHCDCDQRFRGCLRESQSGMANMIGKIYFNILGSRCFDFQESDVCTERSWWGSCQKYERKTVAAVKKQVSFIEEERSRTTNENRSD